MMGKTSTSLADGRTTEAMCLGVCAPASSSRHCPICGISSSSSHPHWGQGWQSAGTGMAKGAAHMGYLFNPGISSRVQGWPPTGLLVH